VTVPETGVPLGVGPPAAAPAQLNPVVVPPSPPPEDEPEPPDDDPEPPDDDPEPPDDDPDEDPEEPPDDAPEDDPEADPDDEDPDDPPDDEPPVPDEDPLDPPDDPPPLEDDGDPFELEDVSPHAPASAAARANGTRDGRPARCLATVDPRLAWRGSVPIGCPSAIGTTTRSARHPLTYGLRAAYFSR
jgi:hypothetical protein